MLSLIYWGLRSGFIRRKLKIYVQIHRTVHKNSRSTVYMYAVGRAWWRSERVRYFFVAITTNQAFWHRTRTVTHFGSCLWVHNDTFHKVDKTCTRCWVLIRMPALRRSNAPTTSSQNWSTPTNAPTRLRPIVSSLSCSTPTQCWVTPTRESCTTDNWA